jgi:antitoxin component of MazEF toxin-antitoxin module
MDSDRTDTSKLQVFHTKLGPARRIRLPAAACQELGIEPGDPLTVEFGPQGIRLLPFDQLIAEIQNAFADCRVEGVNASDELIAERRAEAKREATTAPKDGGPRGRRRP